MNSAIPMYIPNHPPPPPPKCPHCKEELPGWRKPDAITGWEFLLGVVVLILVIGAVSTCAIGMMEGYSNTNSCKDWPTKKMDLLAPTFGLGCSIGHWGSQDI